MKRLLRAQASLHASVVRFFSSLAQYAVRNPKRVVGLATLVTVAALPGIWKLKLRTDGHALVAQNAPEVIYDRRIRDQFGIEDDVVVLIRSEHPDGIFNPGTVRLIRDLTKDLQGLAGINPSNAIGLATEEAKMQEVTIS